MPDFLINTVTAWDEPPRARHQVSFALAKNYPVVFVASNRVGKPGIEIKEVGERLTLVQPSYPLHPKIRIRLPLANGIYQGWLFRRLKKRYPDHQVINFDFTAHRIFRWFGKVIHYCNDECIGNTDYPNPVTDNYYRITERKIVRKALFNVTTAPYLTRKLGAYNPRTYEIPLGANVVPEKSSYHELAEGEKPRICIMGSITRHQVDVNLMNEIIDTGRFHLLIIGPTEKAFVDELHSLENVTLTGVLKGNELTDALDSAHVGLALYNLKKINPGTSPNKLWQYLSVGKPAIVSDLENLRIDEFPERSVYIHRQGDSMEKLILQALEENSRELFSRRIEFTKMNTWDKRMERFMDLYSKA